MRAHFEQPARVWIAGICIGLLATSGIVAIVRSIPASYANIPDEGTAPRLAGALHEAEDTFAKDPQADSASARATINGRNPAWCPKCGVVESMRQVVRSGDAGRQDRGHAKLAGSVFGSAIAANAATERGYEMTVRFRDGSTTVFNEPNPRAWRLGSRVIVIGGSTASNN
jgi:hypothetical protein